VRQRQPRQRAIASFYTSSDKDKNLRTTYRASKSINRELAQDFRGEFLNGENAGLDDEGFARRWLELHPEDTAIMRRFHSHGGRVA